MEKTEENVKLTEEQVIETLSTEIRNRFDNDIADKLCRLLEFEFNIGAIPGIKRRYLTNFSKMTSEPFYQIIDIDLAMEAFKSFIDGGEW
jgi:hypothetical protein